MIAYRDGVPADAAKSLQWAQRIAAQPTAAPYWVNRVADAFFDKGDYAAARPLYERAARKGNTHARARLKQINQGQPHDRPAQ